MTKDEAQRSRWTFYEVVRSEMKNDISIPRNIVLLMLALFLGACSHPVDEPWLNKTSLDFHGNSILLCALCHDLTLECVECHFDEFGSKSPSDDWTHGTTPHDELKSSQTVCNKCHELNRTYGNDPNGCHDCHNLTIEMHLMGEPWLNRTSPDFHGKSSLNCANCHDLTTKCAECHFDETGSKSPSEDWTHGTTPHDETEDSEAVCNKCHELNRTYDNGPNSCHDCHDLSNAHAQGEPWLNRTSPDFHGKSSLNCASCHDLITECAECHFGESGNKSPLEDWTHGTTPHEELEDSEAVCNKCHELNRTYDNGPNSCHDCHDLSNAHAHGEPWLNRTSPDFHGKSSLNCAGCHDLSTECAECHFGESGRKSPSGWTHGTTPHDELKASEAVCSRCHDLNRTYDNGPNSCHDCHDLSNAHAHGEPWLNRTSPDFHGKSSLNCVDCHDLSTECAECHFGESGSKSPSDWSHGTTPHDALEDSEAVCNKCHDLNRTYDNGPGTCHDCHAASPEQHESDNTVCTACHQSNLLDTHNNNCSLCHGSAVPDVQDAVATGKTDCDACHTVPPHAERCGICHTDKSFSDYTGRGVEIHDIHKDRVICGVCHEIPQTIDIGPQNNACANLCHDGKSYTLYQDIHKEHMTQFKNLPNPCYWCHGQSVPQNQDSTCLLCHSIRILDASPVYDMHNHYKRFDCTACHESAAELGTDVRNDQSREVCNFCHTPEDSDAQTTHKKHLTKAQCYSCHGDSDVYASFRGDKDCTICHEKKNESFDKVHKKHAGKAMMCTVCHSIVPPNVEGLQGF